MFSIFDVILIVLLSGFIFYGLFFGFIRVIGGIAGVIIGAILASRFFLLIYPYVQDLFMGHDNLGHIITFIFTFFIIRKIVVLFFAILDKIFNIISIIPFLTTFNRILGAIFGLFEGTLIIGIILFVSSRYTIVEHWFGEWLVESIIAPWLIEASSILLPILPEALKVLKALI